MALDFWDNEDMLKAAGVVAACTTALGVVSLWGNAPDTLAKIVVILKVVSIGVGVGVAFFVGVLLLRLLINIVYATGTAIAAGIDWTIETTLNLFVGMIRAILMAPLVLVGMVWELVRPKAKEKARRQQQDEGSRRSQQNDGGRQEQHQQRQSAGGFSDSGLSEKQALELFELSRPYTLEKLRARRMELLKKVHPDQGGSNMMARMVNEAYEILKSRI